MRSRPTIRPMASRAVAIVVASLLVAIGVGAVAVLGAREGGDDVAVVVRREATLTGPLFGVADAVVHLDDGRVAVGNENLWILDPEQPANLPPEEVRRYGAPIRALAVLGPDRLASAGPDGSVTLWDTSGAVEEVATLDGPEARVTALLALDDGRLASGSGDGTVRVGEPGADAGTAWDEHTDAVVALAILDAGRLLSAGADGLVLLWDLETPDGGPAVVDRHDAPVVSIEVLDDGRLVSLSADGRASVRDPSDLDAPALEVGPAGDGEPTRPNALAVLEGGRIATTGPDGVVRVRDLAALDDGAALLATGADGPAVVLGLGGDLLVTGTADGRVLVWDLGEPDEPRFSAEVHDGPVSGLHRLGHGGFASVGDDGRVVVWSSG